MKVWRQRNPDYHRKYRANNPEYVERDRQQSKQRSRVYRADPANREKILKSQLQAKYNLSLEKYNEYLKKQNNKCAVCFTSPTKNNPLCVDHSHITGMIRGLLCGKCNRSLGMMLDSTILLGRLVDYLNKNDFAPRFAKIYLKTIKMHNYETGKGHQEITREMIEEMNKFSEKTISTHNKEWVSKESRTVEKTYKEHKESKKVETIKGTLEDFL